MKQAYCIFLFLITLLSASGQKIQLTLKPGSSPNKVIAVLKSDAPIAGIISTVQVAFKIPKAGLSTRPGTILVNNFLSTRLAWTPSTIDPSSPAFISETATDYYYTYNADIAAGATAFSFTAGTEVNLFEVGFTGASIPVNLRAVQRPDGGNLVSNGGDFIVMDLENSINFFISVGGIDRTNLVAQFYNGSNVTVSNSGQGYNGESFAAIGGVVLPINWLNFSVIRQVNDAAVSWKVDNDQDNEKYIVEKSLDGTNFSAINETIKRPGAGAKEYVFTDRNITSTGNKILYYRIKNVETSGRFSYTEIKSIRLDRKGETALFPNPAKDGFTLTVPYVSADQKKIQLHLVNNLGQIVEKRDITRLAAANYYYTLQSSLITSGDYLLKIYEDDQLTETKKLLIKK